MLCRARFSASSDILFLGKFFSTFGFYVDLLSLFYFNEEWEKILKERQQMTVNKHKDIMINKYTEYDEDSICYAGMA